jgi:hypothetical protein
MPANSRLGEAVRQQLCTVSPVLVLEVRSNMCMVTDKLPQLTGAPE